MPCQGLPVGVGKGNLIRRRTLLPKPCLQDPTGLRPQGDGAFLAAFAMEVEEGRGAKADLCASQGGDRGDLGDPRAAVIVGDG